MGLLPNYKIGQPQKSTEDLIQRIEPRPLSELELSVVNAMRLRITDALIFLNESVTDGREKSLAITHLEEAMMWTTKAVATPNKQV